MLYIHVINYCIGVHETFTLSVKLNARSKVDLWKPIKGNEACHKLDPLIIELSHLGKVGSCVMRFHRISEPVRG